MRYGVLLAIVGAMLAASECRAQARLRDAAAIKKRLIDLEEQIATLQREAAILRQQLNQLKAPSQAVILTPPAAVEAHKKYPDQAVTVEFGVEEGSGAFRTGLGSETNAITATWDGRLDGGGTFTVILFPKAYAELTIPSKKKGQDAFRPWPGFEREVVGRHIDEHGLRVTGIVRQCGIWPGATNYRIEVADPSKVELFISVAPRSIRQN